MTEQMAYGTYGMTGQRTERVFSQRRKRVYANQPSVDEHDYPVRAHNPIRSAKTDYDGVSYRPNSLGV